MDLLKAASVALQRYFSSVVIYLAFVAALSLSGSGISIAQLIQNPNPEAEPTLTSNLIQVCWFVVYSAVIAIAQCIVFSRIGREIDRPLWKVRDDRDALRRFYMMWFEFNLVTNTFYWIVGTRIGSGELEAVNVMALFIGWFLSVLLVTFGACQMFLGMFSWQTFGDGLGPLNRRPTDFAPVFVITVLQCMFDTYVAMLTQLESTSVPNVAMMTASRLACHMAIGYLDCLVFAAVWIICKDDRDSPDEIDLDF